MLIKFLLNGKEIDLTSDNIIISSDNFNVDKYGNMSCSNANITKGNITLTNATKNESPKFTIQGTSYNQELNTHLYNTGIFCGDSDSDFALGQLSVASGEDGLQGQLQVFNESRSSNSLLTPYELYTGKVYQSSLEEKKKNIEKFNNIALDIIKATDIYKYNLKFENDKTKKHIGFIIGNRYNYSEEVTSENNDGVDIYSMISVAYKAIQEQQEQIEILQNKIKEMEEKINEKN